MEKGTFQWGLDAWVGMGLDACLLHRQTSPQGHSRQSKNSHPLLLGNSLCASRGACVCLGETR